MSVEAMAICFLSLILTVRGPGEWAGGKEDIARFDLEKLFPREIFAGLKIEFASGNIISDPEEEIISFCSWETYGGAILLYDLHLNLIGHFELGKIRAAWLEDLDRDGVMEIIARCGPRQATSYRLETVKVIGWRGGGFREFGEYKEFEGVYFNFWIPFEIHRKLEDILAYIRKTCSEKGLESLETDILTEGSDVQGFTVRGH